MPRPREKAKIDMSQPAFSVDESCNILGISRNTIDKLIHSGALKAVRAGERRWLIPNWAITEFLASPSN